MRSIRSASPHADAWLRGDTRGRDGGVRQGRQLGPNVKCASRGPGPETKQGRQGAAPSARLMASGPPRGPRSLVPTPKMIEPPPAPPRHCQIEEHEAVDDSQLTPV